MRIGRKTKLSTRLLSFAMAAVMLTGIAAVGDGLTMKASAAYDTTQYATPASQEDLNALPKWFTGDDGAYSVGSYAKIVNGQVYVWGSNLYNVLGMASQVDADGKTVENGGKILSPSPMPKSLFGGENVVRVKFAYTSAAALTENGNIYVWGRSLPGNVGKSNQVAPQLIDMSGVPAGRKIVKFDHSGMTIIAQDDQGTWYSAGSGTYGVNLQMGASVDTKKLTPLPASLYSLIGTGITIEKIVTSYQGGFIDSTGDLWVFGNNAGAHSIGCGGGNIQVTPWNATDNQYLMDGATPNPTYGLKFVDVVTEDQAISAIDVNGDVWCVGSSGSRYGRLGTMSVGNVETFYKAYDHLAVNGLNRKAVRVYLGWNNLFILAEDNTLWALGRNTMQMLTTSQAADAAVTTPTQVAKGISEQEAIVGVVAATDSCMIVTKSGQMYFLGSNANGGAGNGTTEDKAKPGEIQPVEPATMPPAEPVTKNEISFGIEYTDRQTSTAYNLTAAPTSSKPNRVYDSVSKSYLDDGLRIEAGSAFKVNVYFEDFGKLHSFVVPIRFDPRYVQVANANNVAYSATAGIVTPAAGSTAGIKQTFSNAQWSEGSLIFGSVSGTYPKINNRDGWVSVQGYTTDTGAKIVGKVKMFSVNFIATGTSLNSWSYLSFANSENAFDFINPTDAGYDEASETAYNYGPFWTLRNTKAGTDSKLLTSNFSFKIADAASTADENNIKLINFQPFVTPLTSLALEAYYNNTAVKDYTQDDPDFTMVPARAINRDSKSAVYTVKVTPNPSNASFPEVNWSYAYVSGEQNGDTTKTAFEDYLTVVQEKPGFMTFKVNEMASFKQDDPIGVMKITATSVTYPTLNYSIYIVLASYKAPDTLEIMKSDSTGANLGVVGDDEMVVTHDKNNMIFGVYYGENAAAVPNKDVSWKLLDAAGNEIANTAEAKAIFATASAAAYTTSIVPQHTTLGETYIVLRVESLIDPTKYDEIKIQIQLYAEELKFEPELIRLVTNSNKNLNEYLKMSPSDIYATDLSWSVTSMPAGDPDNKGDGDTGPFIYGYLGAAGTSAASLFTTGEWATPQRDPSDPNSADEYVVVTVTDALSGLSKSVKLSILSLESPVGIEDITITNALGSNNDAAAVNLASPQIKVGDKIRFFNAYETDYDSNASNADKVLEYVINDAYKASGVFKLGDAVHTLLKNSGGEMAVQILTKDTDGVFHENDRVPVTYSSEPSAVQGYIRLLGKSGSNSALTGIRVDIVGIGHQETVYTTTGGFFKFNEYIAPGSYTLTISKPNYLTRVIQANASTGYDGLVITAAEEFNISTYENPIYLYPGEMTGDNAINVQDISYYVGNWVGLTNASIPDFNDYDFSDDGEPKIGNSDLELVLVRKDWTRTSYPEWTVPVQ